MDPGKLEKGMQKLAKSRLY
jgi:hypothetical protein